MKWYLLAIFLFPFLASCELFVAVALDMALPPYSEGSVFQESLLEFLEPGRTTKQEIRDALTEVSLYPASSQDDSWWLYRASHQGWYEEYIVIRFDRDGVVQDYLVTRNRTLAEDFSAFAIQIDQTSRAEVREIFGEPFELADGRRWIYGHSPSVFSGTCRPFGYFYCDREQDPKSYLLVVFDDHGIVQDYVRNDGRNPCDQSRGICLSSDAIMSFGHADADQRAKQFELSADRCALYVYLRDEDRATSIYMDREWLIDLVSGESYYYYPVEPGMHSLVTKYPDQLYYASLAIDCSGGQLFFARPVLGGINLASIDPGAGVREIKRRLLAADSYPERPALELEHSIGTVTEQLERQDR